MLLEWRREKNSEAELFCQPFSIVIRFIHCLLVDCDVVTKTSQIHYSLFSPLLWPSSYDAMTRRFCEMVIKLDTVTKLWSVALLDPLIIHKLILSQLDPRLVEIFCQILHPLTPNIKWPWCSVWDPLMFPRLLLLTSWAWCMFTCICQPGLDTSFPAHSLHGFPVLRTHNARQNLSLFLKVHKTLWICRVRFLCKINCLAWSIKNTCFC